MKKEFKTIAGLVTGLILGSAALALADWTPPPGSPPSCPSSTEGCNAPLNIGSTDQIKSGSLLLNFGGSSIFGLIVDKKGKVSVGFNGLTDASPQASGVQLEVRNGSIKATDGLIIETRTSDPASPETGRMWLIKP